MKIAQPGLVELTCSVELEGISRISFYIDNCKLNYKFIICYFIYLLSVPYLMPNMKHIQLQFQI
jgi:hypothetical protein